jgi:hypothetical protein
MVSFTFKALYLGERALGTFSIGGWVGPRIDLDAVTKRKNSYPSREWNPDRPTP